jgi:hypothetical protein
MMKFSILYNIDYQPSVHGSSAQYYGEILEQVQLIEELGYDAVSLNSPPRNAVTGARNVRSRERGRRISPRPVD